MTCLATGADILFFLCLNDSGGAEIAMLRVAEGLRARGLNVTAVVYGARPDLARALGFGGEVIDLQTRRTAAAFFPLRRLLRRRKFATVIAALTHTNIIAALAAPKNTRVVATEHGVDGAEAFAHHPLFAILTRYALRRATLIAVSRGLAQRWRDLMPRGDVRTIYNPVVADGSPSAPSAVHAWLGDKAVILGMGRLREEKNFALLLRVFAVVAETRPDARLVIIGEGPERAALENLALSLGVADRVALPGFAADPRGLLAHAALLVCPSKREGFGNAIVEALAEGVPVVACDCPYGPAEILENGRYGRLVPSDDAQAMAQAITDALGEIPDRDLLRGRAAAFTVSRSLDAYQALLGENQKAAATFCVSGFGRWLRSVLFYEHWSIGVVDQPIAKALSWKEAPPVRWLTPFDRSRYFADPFPWPGRPDVILCEAYDTTRGQGRIVALQIAADRVAAETPVDFPVAGHLSFPMSFTHDGELFAMPESCAARRLDIFRRDGDSWVAHACVFDDRPVADAVLFRKDGLFWILYTDVTADPHDNLNLVFAPALTGPWRPHPANPVQRGRDRCRGAGAVFEIDGRLYRPAQDCSHVYGGALRLMEIVTCTPAAYAEKEAAYIPPTSRDYPDGFHTLSAWGNVCLVDGMRLVFSPGLLARKIANRLAHILR